jgi:uncharacterized membrane protein
VLGIGSLYLLAGVVADRRLWLLVAGSLALMAAVASWGPAREEKGGLRAVLLATLLAPAGICLVLALPVDAVAQAPRTTMILLLLPMSVLGAAALAGERAADRPALALAALGVFMLLVPEALFVKDGYGEGLHRMNTVFKSYAQASTLLAVVAPALVARAARGKGMRALLVLLVVVPMLPHLVALGMQGLRAGDHGLDGLAWMGAADRALVEHLVTMPPGTTLVESVGEAYTDAGRISAATGVPAFLGWSNHELVWRGASYQQELRRRRDLVERIYSSTSPEEIARLMGRTGCDLLVIGTLERFSTSGPALEAMRQAGEVVLEKNGGLIIRFPESRARAGTRGPAADVPLAPG